MAMETDVAKFPRIPAIEPLGTRDGALMARLASGDENALGELHDLWCDAVHALVVRSVPDAGEAEQIVETVFVDAWLKAAMYSSVNGSPRVWLLSLASLRATSFTSSASSSLDANSDRDAYHDAAGSSVSRVKTENAGVVRSVLRRLPREQRIVLELACLDGFLLTEIASRLGVPLHAAQTSVRDALRAVTMLLISSECPHRSGPHSGGAVDAT